MPIVINHKGSFNKTFNFLGKIRDVIANARLEHYGQLGVEALKAATPKDTGKTSESWYYEIQKSPEGVSINWYNTNTNRGISIAVLIQYGHATRNGGYVAGIDYINPAMRPVFEKIANDLWLEVTE